MKSHALEFQRLLDAQRGRKEGIFRSPHLAHQTPYAKASKVPSTASSSDNTSSSNNSPSNTRTIDEESTPFPNVARVVTFSPGDDNDDEHHEDDMEDVSLMNNGSQLTDRSPSPPGSTFASSREKQRLRSSSPPGMSPSHPSPPGGRLEDQGADNDYHKKYASQPWAMMGTFQTGNDFASIPELMGESFLSTPDVTPIKSNTIHSSDSHTAFPPVTPMTNLKNIFKTPKQFTDQESRRDDMFDLNVSFESQQSQLDPPSSALSVFRLNEADLALSEQSLYLEQIEELEQQLLEAQTTIVELQQQQQQPESPGIENGASLLLQMKQQALKTPRTPKPLLPPTLDALWERNQTLTKEVRFADQTCVELSSEKSALERRVQSANDQLEQERRANERLSEQVKEVNQLLAQAQTRSNHDAERLESLQQERLQDKETIHNLQQELEKARHELESREQQMSLTDALQQGLAEARENKEHVQLVDAMQKELVQVTDEKMQLTLELEQLSGKHEQLQQAHDAVLNKLRNAETRHQSECAKMAAVVTSAVEWMTENMNAIDQSSDRFATEWSARVLSLTRTVSAIQSSVSAHSADVSPVLNRGSPESAIFFTPTNESRLGTNSADRSKDLTTSSSVRDSRVCEDDLEGMRKALHDFDSSDMHSCSSTPKTVSFAPSGTEEGNNDPHMSMASERSLYASPDQVDANSFQRHARLPASVEAQYEARVMELTAALDSLNNSNEQLTEERDLLQRELTSVQDKISGLKSFVKPPDHLSTNGMATEGMSDSDDSRPMSKTGEELCLTVDEIMQYVQEAVNSRIALSDELEMLQKHYEAVLVQRDTVAAGGQAMSGRVDELLKEVTILQQASDDFEALQKDHANLYDDKRKIREEYERLNRKLAEEQALIKRLEDERDLLIIDHGQKELTELRSAETDTLCVTLRQQVEALEEAVIQKDREVDGIRKEVDNLLEAASEREKIIEALEDENDRIRQETHSVISDMEKRVMRLGSELEKSLSTGKHFHNRCADLEESLREWQDKHSLFKRESEDALSGLDAIRREKEDELAMWHEQLSSLETLAAKFDESGVFSPDPKCADRSDRVERIDRFLGDLLTQNKAQLDDLAGELAGAKDLLELKEAEVKSSAENATALQSKVDKLKGYVRKLTAKCDEWEGYSVQQAEVIAQLKQRYNHMRRQAIEVLQTFEEQEQVYSHERALWESEKHQFTSQFEDISRVLLDIPSNSVLNSPPAS